MNKSELDHVWHSVTSALEKEFWTRGWFSPQAARIEQLEAALRHDNLCEDEGCPNAGTPHVCINRVEQLEKHKRLQMEDVMNLGAQLGQAWRRIAQLEAQIAADTIRLDKDAAIMEKASARIKTQRARIEQLEAEVEKWHRVAMEAGAITCSDGRHIYPRRERIEQLEAVLRAILIETDCRVAADLARAALAQSSPQSAPVDRASHNSGERLPDSDVASSGAGTSPARQENDDVYPGFRGNNEA
jgi:hypothetical protein